MTSGPNQASVVLVVCIYPVILSKFAAHVKGFPEVKDIILTYDEYDLIIKASRKPSRSWMLSCSTN